MQLRKNIYWHKNPHASTHTADLRKKIVWKVKKNRNFFAQKGRLRGRMRRYHAIFFLDLKNLRIFFNQHLSMQRFHSNDACGGLTKKVIFTSVLRNFAHATSQLWIYIAYFSASQRGVGVAEWVKRRRRRWVVRVGIWARTNFLFLFFAHATNIIGQKKCTNSTYALTQGHSKSLGRDLSRCRALTNCDEPPF